MRTRPATRKHHVVAGTISLVLALTACSNGGTVAEPERIVDATPGSTAESQPNDVVPSPPSTPTLPAAAERPTESELLNAEIPGAVMPGCPVGERIQLVNGELRGTFTTGGFSYGYAIGVGRRADGTPMIDIPDSPRGDADAIMIVSSVCEYTGRFATSNLMTCNAAQCEIALEVIVDDLPFVPLTVTTTQTTDLSVNGDEIVVTVAVCSADQGCSDVFQRYRWGSGGITPEP